MKNKKLLKNAHMLDNPKFAESCKDADQMAIKYPDRRWEVIPSLNCEGAWDVVEYRDEPEREDPLYSVSAEDMD